MLFPITFLAVLAIISPLFSPILGHPVPFIQGQNSVDTLLSREPHKDDSSFISTLERRDGAALSNAEYDLFERDSDMGATTEEFERRFIQDKGPVVKRRGFFKKLKKKVGKIAGKLVKAATKVGGIAGKIAAGATKVAGIAGKVASTLGPLVLKRQDLAARDLSLSHNPSPPALASRSIEWAKQGLVFQRDMNLQPEGWVEERSMDSSFELDERDFDFDSEEDFE